jgi:hypothetical protein
VSWRDRGQGSGSGSGFWVGGASDGHDRARTKGRRHRHGERAKRANRQPAGLGEGSRGVSGLGLPIGDARECRTRGSGGVVGPIAWRRAREDVSGSGLLTDDARERENGGVVKRGF